MAQAEDAQVRGTLKSAATGAGLASACTSGSASCLVGIIGQVISIVLGLIGGALLAYLVYAGILWMTAGGETERIGQAQTVIKNAVIGMAVIGLAYALANFVVSTLSASFDKETQQGQTTTPTGPEGTPPGPTESAPTVDPFRTGCMRATCTTECVARDACSTLTASRRFNCESSCQTRCTSYCALVGP